MSDEDHEEVLRKELFEIMMDHQDGALDQIGRDRLNKLLRASPQARHAYLDEAMIDSFLAGELWAEPEEPQGAEREERRTLFPAMALCLLLVGMAVVWFSGVFSPQPMVGLVEVGNDKGLESGSRLSAGVYTIGDAQAQFRLDGGSRILVEGPAQFEVLGTDRISVAHGRLRAILEDAEGQIAVETALFEVVDLGTEFGVELDGSNGASIHVFDGAVKATLDGASREVGAGSALAWEGGAFAGEIPAQPDRFAAFHAPSGQQARWQLAMEKLVQGDPRVLALYRFEDLSSGLVDGTARGRHGEIFNASVSAGRWLEKSALEFSQPDARVEIEIPGRHDDLTFSAWIRIDALTDTYQGILTSQEEGPGGIRLHVTKAGELALGVLGPGNQRKVVKSRRSFSPSEVGKWHHVAATYEGVSGGVSLYLNGRPVARNKMTPRAARIGQATIGNWQKENRRPLSGAIDELIVWSSVLDPKEIAQLAQAGMAR